MPQGQGSLPEPPWSQAPSEVTAWLSSTGGRRSARARPPPRQLRVRGFVARCSSSEERRLLRRLVRYHFERASGEAEPLSRALDRLVHLPPAETFRGTVAGTRILVRLREGTEHRVRIGFTPRLTERNASKILARLGIDALEGSWL